MRYRPADPDAYAPSAGVPRREVAGAVGAQVAIVAPLVNGVMFVIGSEMTPWRLAERAVETLRGARDAGSVRADGREGADPRSGG